MDNIYFENIEKHCQITDSGIFDKNDTILKPTRKINRGQFQGVEIKKDDDVSALPDVTLERMVEGATKKYKKMTEQIINQIRTSKRKGNVKYQTLGWKHAKVIKSWCDENNINCNIVTDPTITRNKLVNIDIWFSIDGNLYDDGYEDYGNQYLDFHSIKQNVVYVEVKL